MRALIIAIVGLQLFACWLADLVNAKPRDRRIERCMVYLPAVRDAGLRRWCLVQQRRMP
jgi:hypothetical protein